VNFSRRQSRRTAIKKYRSERKGRRSFDTAIEYGTVAMMATEKTRTAKSAVRATLAHRVRPPRHSPLTESFLPPHANLPSYLRPNYHPTLECRHVTHSCRLSVIRRCATSGGPSEGSGPNRSGNTGQLRVSAAETDGSLGPLSKCNLLSSFSFRKLTWHTFLCRKNCKNRLSDRPEAAMSRLRLIEVRKSM